MLKSWFELTMLSLESQSVIGLRLMKLAGGGPQAQVEVERMLSEKIGAAIAATHTLATGGSASAVIEIYRKAVKKNKRRLGSPRRRASPAA
jgi:hypothetical protein